jgi:hypothetical protein
LGKEYRSLSKEYRSLSKEYRSLNSSLYVGDIASKY